MTIFAGPSKGVSVITVTKRPKYFYHLLFNYSRQLVNKKELVIILNNNDLSLEKCRRIARTFSNVRVYQLNEKVTLGHCLNFAARKCKYPFIAKFDDDDYYAPLYLTDILRTFKRTEADIVGKRAHFMYLKGSKMLIFRFHEDENKYCTVLPGATLVIKRRVLKKVRFRNRNVGEDDQFCRDSKEKGFKIFSGSKYHFAAVRRKNSRNHTWIISEKKLLSTFLKLGRVKNYRTFVSRGMVSYHTRRNGFIRKNC